MEPTRDPRVDNLTLEEALKTQGLKLEDPKRWATRTKIVRDANGNALFAGSHLDIWKWLWLRFYFADSK